MVCLAGGASITYDNEVTSMIDKVFKLRILQNI